MMPVVSAYTLGKVQSSLYPSVFHNSIALHCSILGGLEAEPVDTESMSYTMFRYALR
jgi:hypothetical protein